MPREEQTVYTKIVEIREKHARELNLPPNTILNKQHIVDIAYNIHQVKHIHFTPVVPQNRQKMIISEILALA